MSDTDLQDEIRYGRDEWGHVRRCVIVEHEDGSKVATLRCDHDDCPGNDDE